MKKPIINCHTHIFTGDSVPPFLAKTFLPCPLYFLLPVCVLVSLFRAWYSGPYTWQFKPWYRNIGKVFYSIKMAAKRNGALGLLSFLLGLMLTIHVFFILVDWLSKIKAPGDSVNRPLQQARDWLADHRLLYIPASAFGKLLLVLLLIIFFKSGRNLIWFALRKIWSALDVLPGPKTKDLARRYVNIGRFAFYRKQAGIFDRLKDQYPAGTGFVVLPMDMEYMDAGKLKKDFRYREQMEALAAIKRGRCRDIFFPFVFAEPRRMAEEGDAHFKYRMDAGSVVLEECFIKRYIEDLKFSGFKIYPALGYYAFDEGLLPLWKYAADHGLPILTHCIRGTIFYRGKKKKAWDHHPVFEQACGDDVYEPMLMMETANVDFINNFTHPLNYLCLLEEQLLRKLVGKAADPRIRELFGYTDEQTPMVHNLSHLKLCFGHFGGDDEWDRFIEYDRDNYARELVKDPANGIDFLTHESTGKPAPGKPEQIWKFADWYSIICSMMLQYPNVYADLSYIIHSPAIQPLLKQTLLNPKLKERTLFGTDFYVVRNHKSEKNMLADVLAYLTEDEFDQIARTNPRTFLSNSLHGPITI